MRLRWIFVSCAALLFSLTILAQEAQTPKPCIAAGETIYEPGVGGVNPPQPKPDKSAKNAPKIHGTTSLELIVDGEGNLCSVKILSASDRNSAQQIADYISRHWSFKPATKNGKPVAVKFTMNFRAN